MGATADHIDSAEIGSAGGELLVRAQRRYGGGGVALTPGPAQQEA